MRTAGLIIAATGLLTAAGLIFVTSGTEKGEIVPEAEIRATVEREPAREATAEAARTGLGPAIGDRIHPAPEPDAAPRPEPPRDDAVRPRAIAPSVVAPPQVDPATLERVEPRAPLSGLAAPAPPKKKKPKPILFRPVANAAGIIEAGGLTITIVGIETVGDGETCAGRDDAVWPCGRAARTAFRGMLRGRAVTCDLPEEDDVPETITTACRVGGRDIGAWLVANGWARAAGETYAALGTEAREAERGVYGTGPDALTPGATLPEPSETPAVRAGPEAISILPDVDPDTPRTAEDEVPSPLSGFPPPSRP